MTDCFRRAALAPPLETRRLDLFNLEHMVRLEWINVGFPHSWGNLLTFPPGLRCKRLNVPYTERVTIPLSRIIDQVASSAKGHLMDLYLLCAISSMTSSNELAYREAE